MLCSKIKTLFYSWKVWVHWPHLKGPTCRSSSFSSLSKLDHQTIKRRRHKADVELWDCRVTAVLLDSFSTTVTPANQTDNSSFRRLKWTPVDRRRSVQNEQEIRLFSLSAPAFLCLCCRWTSAEKYGQTGKKTSMTEMFISYRHFMTSN